ncbi:hypothetical protein T492DRAFT_1051700 [Pavlovales sp. CCMP2436]|nr:hypothetical protein T492DRAFT_1051700 [Pavlovales sp. CCMP2436]
MIAAATGVAAIAFVALRKKDSIMAAFEEAWPTPEEKQSVLYDPSKAANPAPDANTDASLMASLRDRLLNTGSAPVGEDVEFRPVTDDELDEEQKAVRDQRAAYPAKDGGVGSGLLDRPSGNAPPAPANMLGDAAPAAQAPEMASAESIAFMERMFKAGDGGK